MSRHTEYLRDIAELIEEFGEEGWRDILVAADLLDEAEKALANILDRAQFIGEPEHDADAWADADSNARATLARIRGEKQ
jgi:hypothetical protein